MLEELLHRVLGASIRAIIWAFIGSLYGIIFIFFYNLAEHWALPLNSLFIAGTLAGTIAALIYSSMSLALIVTPITSVVCLFYIINNGNEISLSGMTFTAFIIGSIAGALYGLKAKNSHIFRAGAKTLAGISAGAVVALFIMILAQSFADISMTVTVAIACLLTGSLYITLAPFYVQHFHKLLPPVLDGAMVGAGTSVFIALLFFVMITGVTPEAAGSLQPLTEQIRNTMLSATLGGALGGGLSGFMAGLMLRKWHDL